MRRAAVALLLAGSCQGRPEPQPSPSAGRAFSAPDAARHPLPSRWVGASFEKGRIAVSVTEVGEKPRRAVLEPPVPGRAPGSLEVTDVAYDPRRERIFVATCCEPGSGRLRRIEWRPLPAFLDDDQGFAVDVGGPAPTMARTDTFGTLRAQPAGGAEEELSPDAGVADVAVDGRADARVVALVDSKRLQALVPTVSWHEPALLVEVLEFPGVWSEVRYPLPPDRTYCRVVPLGETAVGLLAGAFDRGNPVVCTGDRLDVYDMGRQRLRDGALRFPAPVRHLSIDESSTFLIFTTVDGAVGWQALDGRAGDLAPEGFLAADW